MLFQLSEEHPIIAYSVGFWFQDWNGQIVFYAAHVRKSCGFAAQFKGKQAEGVDPQVTPHSSSEGIEIYKGKRHWVWR